MYCNAALSKRNLEVRPLEIEFALEIVYVI